MTCFKPRHEWRLPPKTCTQLEVMAPSPHPHACVQLWEAVDDRPTWVVMKTIENAHRDRITCLVRRMHMSSYK